MSYDKLRQDILNQYQETIQPIVGDKSYLSEMLLSGLDKILLEQFDLQRTNPTEPKDYSRLSRKTLPDNFQLSLSELLKLQLPEPFDEVQVDELRAYYGNPGFRAYGGAFRHTRSNPTTLLDMKRTLLDYREKATGETKKPAGVGKKAAIAMESYLILKSKSE